MEQNNNPGRITRNQRYSKPKEFNLFDGRNSLADSWGVVSSYLFGYKLFLYGYRDILGLEGVISCVARQFFVQKNLSFTVN